MDDLNAQLLLPEGPALITAEGGSYSIDEEEVAILGPVRLVAADGYAMMAEGVSINLERRTMAGTDGVSGEVPAGTFSAREVSADLSERTITLTGNAKLTMVPGQLRMP